MIVIRASDKELDVSGSIDDLNSIAMALSELSHGQICRIEASNDADPSPYPNTLSALEAYISDGPVRVSVDDCTLYISGSLEMVKRSASWFKFEPDGQSGDHCHHEWFEGNTYICPTSRPLVISIA
jgi:hypothetical protein